jgi:hypothetical protein
MQKNHQILTATTLFLLLFSCTAQVKNKKHISLEEVQNNGLRIEIADSSLRKLMSVRKEAIALNLLKDKKSYVDAKLICGHKSINTSIRFKGDHVDHLDGNRWSFRVKTKQKGLLFGENKFSIQGVHTRSFLNEWVFHKLLEKEGLVYLQYHFIPFQINDIDSLKGIYAFESHFKTNLLKVQNKKPGPIAKFDEELFWDYSYRNGEENRDSLIMTESKIKLTAKKGYDKNLKEILIKNIDDYRKKIVAANAVLDVEKWAKFIVINGIMKSKHALRWHNLRFYLNPDTKLIEPVGFDCISWHLEKGPWFLKASEQEVFYKSLYQSKEFVLALQKETIKMAERSYLKGFFHDNKKEIDENIKLIQLEDSTYKFWPISFYKNQDVIKAYLKLSKQ